MTYLSFETGTIVFSGLDSFEKVGFGPGPRFYVGVNWLKVQKWAILNFQKTDLERSQNLKSTAKSR